MEFSRRQYILVACLTGLAVLLGIAIDHYVLSPGTEELRDQFELEQDLVKQALHREIDPMSIRSYLKILSEEPHLAGEERDTELVDWMKKTWEEVGLDHVELATYDVFLSYPNRTNPNKIYLYDTQGRERFASNHKETELREGDDHPNFIHAFHAYAPADTVKVRLSDVIYVNFGRKEDFQQLRELGVSLQGRICLARYGKVFRGNKLKNCQDEGGVGIIVFSDPAQVAPYGTGPEDVYPNAPFLPGSGIQRGSVSPLLNGDPLSYGQPSIEHAYRSKPEDITLPTIPSQPIGYDDAREILDKMSGPDPPAGWKGELQNIPYKLGGVSLPGYEGWNIQLEVHNFERTVKTSNIQGYIRGSMEPDRYVFVGNHRDAWGFGAVDPSTGTATLMEIARVLGKLHKDGWRPRRTIVFCSWAAEEFALIGSSEWVNDKIHQISQRAVGLVNIDSCVAGPIILPKASPMIQDVVRASLKAASDPTDVHPSYYEFWKAFLNGNKTHHGAIEPNIPALSSGGSDHASFTFFAGVPSSYARYRSGTKTYAKDGSYPLYHTGYETFHAVDRLIDPGFKIHRTCSQSSMHMALNMADSLLLPYNLDHISTTMMNALDNFKSKGLVSLMEDNGATIDYLKQAVAKFAKVAKNYMNYVQHVELESELHLRQINDQMMQLERVFLLKFGLPGRPFSKHALFSPAKFNFYGSSVFPGITDLLHGIEELEENERVERWDELKKHLSELMIVVNSATHFLDQSYFL